MDSSVRPALETTAKRYFDMAARGDSSGLQQNSIPVLASSFGGVEAAIRDNQAPFAGAKAELRPPFLLIAEGSEPMARAEFLCGVFGASGQTSRSAVFNLSNLPPGKYGVVILDVTGAPAGGAASAGTQDARAVTMILEQIGADWKLAGFYARQSTVNGHDAQWFAERARQFKTKGQSLNTWLYFRQATALATPVDFMSTLATDKLYDETRAAQPSDLPSAEHPLIVIGQPAGNAPAQPSQKPPVAAAAAQGKSFSITQIFPLAVDKDLDVVLKYQAPDVSNTGQVFQDNLAVTRGFVAKFPELREAFAGVVARAVEPSGRDYGSLMMMKDVK